MKAAYESGEERCTNNPISRPSWSFEGGRTDVEGRMAVDNCNIDNPEYFNLKYNCEDIKLDQNVKKVPYCECVPMGIVGRTAAGKFSEEKLDGWEELYMTFSPPTGSCSRVRTPNAEIIKRNTKPWKDIPGKYEVKKASPAT